MELHDYVRTLRRRWRWIIALMVIGAALGAGSAVLTPASGESGPHFKATHELFFDSNLATNQGTTSSPSSPLSLEQAAVRATSGEVSKRVGNQLGESPARALDHVLITANAMTNTLDITAVARRPRESEAIADGFAGELVARLNEIEQQRFASERSRVIGRLDQVQREIAVLDAQIAGAAPSDQGILGAQRNGLVNEYRLAYEQLQALAETPSELALSTIHRADATPIDSSEYAQRIDRARRGDHLTLITGAPGHDKPPTFGSGTALDGPVGRALLGAFLGLLIGIGLASVLEQLDRRLRSRTDAEEAFGLPVLAEVPRMTRSQQRRDEVLTQSAPLSQAAEAHRGVRSALLFAHANGTSANGNGQGRAAAGSASFVEPNGNGADHSLVVLIVSAQPEEGKTTTAANLSAAFAQSGASVLAVNCDFRRPMLHRYLGSSDEPGRVLPTKIPGVSLVSGVLPDGEANPAQIVAAQRELIATARRQFDVVVLDTAPLLTANDPLDIVPSADLALVVARLGMTTHDSSKRVRDLLMRVDAPMAGLVLVATEATRAYYSPYYQSSRDTTCAAREQGISWRPPRNADADERELVRAKARLSGNGKSSGNGVRGAPKDSISWRRP